MELLFLTKNYLFGLSIEEGYEWLGPELPDRKVEFELLLK